VDRGWQARDSGARRTGTPPMYFLEHAPLLLLWPLLALAFLLAQEIGYRGWRRFARPVANGEDTDGARQLLSASLALLGLLIAFTFSMATQRFDARRFLVVDEANAVGTTYLRFQLLPEPARTTLSRQLLAYNDNRTEFLRAGPDEQVEARIDARTGVIQAQMWQTLTAALAAQPNATVNPSLLQTTNEMFDLAATDRAALNARIPITIIRTLVIYGLIAALIMGSVLATGKRRYFIGSATVFVLVALAISLILDLDRPRTGTITVSDRPFAEAAASIRAMEAAHTPQR
jgi:hypothetical protein